MEIAELYHHGILGMKWGVRRYQNKDGSLTSAGRKRYGGEKSLDRKISKAEQSRDKILEARSKNRDRIAAKYDKQIAKSNEDLKSYDPIRDGLKDKSGRDILTKDDVSQMTKALEDRISELQSKKSAKIKDFDEGTKYVKAGEDYYVDVIRQYKDAKVAAFEDSAYKQSDAYKSAVKSYVNQVMYDNLAFGGSAMTKLGYAYDLANGTYSYRVKPKK